jgi:hypothetical protein
MFENRWKIASAEDETNNKVSAVETRIHFGKVQVLIKTFNFRPEDSQRIESIRGGSAAGINAATRIRASFPIIVMITSA